MVSNLSIRLAPQAKSAYVYLQHGFIPRCSAAGLESDHVMHMVKGKPPQAAVRYAILISQCFLCAP